MRSDVILALEPRKLEHTLRRLRPGPVGAGFRGPARVDLSPLRGRGRPGDDRPGARPDLFRAKLAWLFAADAALRKRAATGELLVGTLRVGWPGNLCGGAAHITEP
ncbi:MAG: hypothetical protein MSC30_05455 [Gaiellaceae bacterium MAG52_C11]|nr:hypothetical protein [Candidatus Gaiellasilicea maunaloa]